MITRLEDIEIRPCKGTRDFDLIKWFPVEYPWLDEDENGQQIMRFEGCCYVGRLKWKNNGFQFHSNTVLWIDLAPSKQVCAMIMNVLADATYRYVEEDTHVKN